VAFRSTEISVRDVLLEEIRARGIRIGHELSAPLPTGRMAPDAILTNGSEYVLETKLGGEADLFEDIKKLTEWIKLTMIPIKGAFAVLLPGEFRNLPWQTIKEVANSPNVRFQVAALFRDDRPGDRRIGSLSEIADWIANHILNPPKEIEIDTEFVIKVLAGAVGQLTYQMRDLDVKQLEDIFGGRSVFDNILEISPGNVPIEDLHSAASYLLINQLIFYQVLSHAEPTHYQTIDVNNLRTPSDLSRYFQKVLEVDYAPTFGFDIASRLPNKSIDLLKSLTEVIQAMGVARLRQDVLGKVFHNLIPLSIRKSVAAYYTNGRAAELLASLSVEDSDDTILDPACGSGTLLVASYQRKRQLLTEKTHNFTSDDHKRFLGEEITGIDIMPFAAHLAVVHLSLQAPHFITQKARVAVEDSTKLKPGDRIPSITRELNQAFRYPTLDMFEGDIHPKKRGKKFIEKGVLTPGGFGGEELQLDSVDVVIMNPPFTSSDHLKPEYKVILKKRFGKKYDGLIRGKISFQGHFLLLADKFLRKGGRIAAVLPQTTFTGDAFGPLIDMLMEKYTLKVIVVGLGRMAFSENTALSEVLLIAEKSPPKKDQKFALLGTKTSPSEWSAGTVKKITNIVRTGKDWSDDNVELRIIPQDTLSMQKGGLARLLPSLLKGHKEVSEQLKPIFESSKMMTYGKFEEKTGINAFCSELNNREIEGPNGRGNIFFGTSALNIFRDGGRSLRSSDRLVLKSMTANSIRVRDRISSHEFSLPREVIRPAIRTLSYCYTMDSTSQSDWIISKYVPEIDRIIKEIYGSQKVSIYPPRIKKIWPSRVESGSARLHIARKVNLSAPGTIHISTFTEEPSFLAHPGWGVSCSPEDAKILCLWFNSTLLLFQLLSERTQIGGTWWRLDKKRIARTLIPKIDSLEMKDRTALIDLFDEIKLEEFPPIIDQLKNGFHLRKQVDAQWLKILGVNDNEINEILDGLYPYLFDTLSQLQKSMKM
jgi:type I restriction-modification system DNA methylase subunit